MKKFIFKTSLFVVPFAFLYVITSLFYSSSECPDLIRLGCFPNVFKECRNVFHDEFTRKIYFNKFSKRNNKTEKILTIGDSFSEQGNYGYTNYLAEKYGVLHMDRFISGNQIQTLYELLNGDFFEKQNIEYVILENVERSFVSNAKKIDSSKVMMTSQLDNLVRNRKLSKEDDADAFFSKKTIQFPFSMFRYYFSQNYLSNRYVYNVVLTRDDLFSIKENNLLFVYKDLSCLEENNDVVEVQKLNNVLNDLSNKLRGKKIKLIVLPAPDKYDLYYDYIADKTIFPRPLFFNHLGNLKKNYVYIDSKKILSAELESKKDIYFYDDTHWSPVASKIIVEEIKKAIN
ncbi:SGNH hydrolase-like domain-containing protein, acetyltransferase AlgX [Flavobacterium aquidurense]|uniref:AlgX/AlgJ SGNH hydrolase-like domain-containing protein n=1 Tax=Flavobacterium frigidimaris TaxID=262320 RepID=A0ABX4BX75_FLAFR|nr:hypothetical protein [Flavobacterium frigidimaris]OXA82589.1 hypothetical protein B0A65_00900 [Flavobacterium frigidimaris]SDZ46364.1 SGNH hydrolase-like domain-containing protein, acetyltransferase AlgX [Flavobacterium aquidurense]